MVMKTAFGFPLISKEVLAEELGVLLRLQAGTAVELATTPRVPMTVDEHRGKV